MGNEQFQQNSDKFDIAALLDGSQAHIAKDGAKSLVDDRTLLRFWTGRSPIALEQACKVLRARRTETNPVADQKTFPGIWRVQNAYYKTEAKSETGYVYEQLALGLLTEFSAANPDPDVRMAEVDVYPQANPPSLRLVRHWPYVDPLQTATLITILKGVLTVTDPIASMDTYTGVWSVGKAYATKNEDGSDDIFQELYLNLLDMDETYAVNCKEDMRIVEKLNLSLAGLNAALAEFQRSAYSPGKMNSVSISIDRSTGLYSLSVRQKIGIAVSQTAFTSLLSVGEAEQVKKDFNGTTPDAGLPNIAPAGQIATASVELNDMCLYDKTVGIKSFYPLRLAIQYQSEDKTKVFIHKEHVSGDELQADINTYLIPANKNSATGGQETNGLLNYEFHSAEADNDNLTSWPSEQSFRCTVWYGSAFRDCNISTRYFSTASDACNYCDQLQATAGFSVVNAVSGHATAWSNAYKNIIWKAVRVEVNNTSNNPQPM